MDKQIADQIATAIKDIVTDINPDVRYVAKYGGEVLALDPTDDSKFVGGIFAYKDHISLEFSKGASLNDPNQQLEGKGKKRRHLKFKSLEDVTQKESESFLKQALRRDQASS